MTTVVRCVAKRWLVVLAWSDLYTRERHQRASSKSWKSQNSFGGFCLSPGEPAGDISGRKRSFQAGFHKLLHASSGLCFLCASRQTCMILWNRIDNARHLRKRKVMVGGGGPGPQDNTTGPPKPTLLPIPGLLSCGWPFLWPAAPSSPSPSALAFFPVVLTFVADAQNHHYRPDCTGHHQIESKVGSFQKTSVPDPVPRLGYFGH